VQAMLAMIGAFRRDEGGASAVEYALLVAGIAIAIAATVFVVGNSLNNMFNNIAHKVH
jgi:pilus assembly protein Flp/PilA